MHCIALQARHCLPLISVTICVIFGSFYFAELHLDAAVLMYICFNLAYGGNFSSVADLYLSQS